MVNVKQRWEIINWTNQKRIQLCDSKEVATRLLPYHGKNHIIREIWFTDDGKFYDRGEYEQFRGY